ncbi:hypothetical protein BD410DRAFT_837468 [Rickenella mellea]|uniref:Uncharacterized protein n=1 Tax=Rickenella mellea TaxID=50990 RepID=A0A4Y7QC40_9AGAM|nr:hypothetical protein BD410DRAFT_837468 [Rickenella mellea]
MTKARPRPVSDQPLGRRKPKGIVVNSDGDGVMTILDAATANLASLINPLDLEGSVGSKASDGQVNLDFKFGGKLAQIAELKPVEEQPPAKPQTLSDIIPPPAHPSCGPSMSFSMLEEDSSILKSICAKATAQQAARPRVDSESSSKCHARQVASHKHHSSELSFSALSSFGESQSYSFSRNHGRNESVFSIALVSSYGMLIWVHRSI